MTKRYLILAFAMLCSPAWAQLSITVKKASSTVTSTTTAVTVDTTQVLAIDGTEIGGAITVERSPVINSTTAAKPVGVIVLDVSPRTFDNLLVRLKSKTAKAILVEPGVYQVSEPGKHEFSIMVFGSDPMTLDEDDIVVEVSGTPTPKPDDPPKPPTPVGPSPIEGAGLRVLFVAETGETIPREVEASYYSPEIAAYLNSNCIKVDGHPDFRRLDPDAQFTDPNHRFAKALARPRASLPWLIISNGTSGYEGPFPKTMAETLTLIRSFVPAPQATRPSLTVYSIANCEPCLRWKKNESHRVLGVNYSEVADTAGLFKEYPTFVLSKYGKQVVLSGYKTAETIVQTLDGIK